MENVAHTLAGLVLGEAVIALRRDRSPAFVRSALFTSALAGNLPDADILYAGTMDRPLGYLLHHRGHTHTIAGGLALGILLAITAIAVLRRRGLAGGDLRWIGFLAVLGPIVHLGMDAANVYGTHPFWPIDGRWVFGDAVFIVEPLLWAVALPPLVALARGRAWRVTLGGLLLAGLVLPWVVAGFVPLVCRVALVAVAALSSLGAWLAGRRGRVTIALVGFCLVFLGFAAVGREARAVISSRLAETWPDESRHDLALTPLPANPFCWSAVSVTIDGGDLVLRRATIATWSSLLDASRCPSFATETTAPLRPVDDEGDAAIRWEGVWRAPLSELVELAQEDCEIAAFLRFARAPFWLRRREGIVIGDLRFDREQPLGFAELHSQPGHGCPAWVPPWTPPLAEVMTGKHERGRASPSRRGL
ncbi:MAG: metal-dependent hydrolase [Deltaproteobacteria bacterium]|nr:metal-dependent hydrolase [Deltaproteobacteria bacterium]